MESSALGPGLIGIAYLVSSVLFVYGLKGLSHPRTAVRANLLGASAMTLAILVTLLDPHISRYGVIFAGLAVGAAIGGALAARVQMTAMPQMVA
ncbi:MAG: NAD(P)(+) transhydrogenase (Re/Si-specific) subunit beta, partial [Candidatus Methylomirabilis sp.]|nr:NAD(P)(+) transhydrogenase (Re/Si-specific) subunit beta [Deltaproteobacteria bacterium]